MNSRAIALLFSAFVLAATAVAAGASEPTQTPQQFIKDVVYNELVDHRQHGCFEYIDARRTGRQVIVKAEVETRIGRVDRLISTDGKPPTAEEEAEEAHRLESLLRDRTQQQKLLRDYQDDENRIARIIALLPDGFLYRFDGVEGEDIRLKYEPNPDFQPPTYEAKIFHGMVGTIWVNARQKRLSRVEGRLVSNVDFGYGLLGRLDKGGTFNLERVQVSSGSWKTKVLDVHITGHVILLKSIGKDQEEVRSRFRQMPSDLSLEQAEAMLHQPYPPNGSPGTSQQPANPQSSMDDHGQRRVTLALK